MKISFILVAICIFIALILPTVANSEKEILEVGQEQKEKTRDISYNEIVQLTDGFLNTLIQETDKDYRVLKYQDKASIIDAFKHITTEEVVKAYVDYYYYEENGGLYIVPTETPPWFNKQNEYDVVQLEKNKFLVKQENESELYGEYRIEMEFTYTGQDWKITKITHL